MPFTPGIYAMYTSHQVKDAIYELVTVASEGEVYMYGRTKTVVSTSPWTTELSIPTDMLSLESVCLGVFGSGEAWMTRPPVLFEIEERDYRALALEVPQYLLRRIVRSIGRVDPSEYEEFSLASKTDSEAWGNSVTRFPPVEISDDVEVSTMSHIINSLVNHDAHLDRIVKTFADGAPIRNSKLKEKQKIEAVTALIPQPEASYTRPNGVRYYPRPWGDYQDIPVIQKARETGQAIFLFGPPGTGKTAMVEAAFGEELITFLGSGDTEVADLVGSYVQNPDATYSWVDGPLLIAAEQGRPILLDEVGLIDSKCLSVVYSLMDGRGEITVTANPERGTIKAAKGFYVMGATNPNAPGVHLSEALMSRFAIHTEVTTDWELATRLGVPDVMVRVGGSMNKQYANNTIGWAPQLREALAFRDIYNTFGLKFAMSNLVTLAPGDEERAALNKALYLVTATEVDPASI